MTNTMSNAHYARKQGFICPFCAGDDLDVTSPVTPAGDTALQGVICKGCGRHWEDICVLAGYQKPDDPPDTDPEIPSRPEDIPDDLSIRPSLVHS